MKVLLVNGSPHKNGSTDRALQEVAKTLEAGGVETEIFWIGTAPIGGCIGCGGCGKKGECVFGGPVVEFVRKAKTADGFVFGSPVHYAAASGNMTSFLDRAFYSADADVFRFKPAGFGIHRRHPHHLRVIFAQTLRAVDRDLFALELL